MMVASLRLFHESRVPLAVLYASTDTLYRAVGYGLGGASYSWKASTRALAGGDRGLPLHPVEGDVAATLAPLQRKAAAAGSGQLDRCAGLWSRLLERKDGSIRTTWIVGSPEAPEGYAVVEPVTEASQNGLWVADWAACSAAAARRLWALVADHRSLIEEVWWAGPAIDPMTLHLAEPELAVSRPKRWMLRLVDFAEALRARGWPPGVAGELVLDVSDAALPVNAGRWTLQVAGGRGSVRRGGKGPALAVDAPGMASLFTGVFTGDQLQSAGLAEGDPAVVQVANRLFAGPAPWMPDRF
jgi:predicted acetyltransferase